MTGTRRPPAREEWPRNRASIPGVQRGRRIALVVAGAVVVVAAALAFFLTRQPLWPKPSPLDRMLVGNVEPYLRERSPSKRNTLFCAVRYLGKTPPDRRFNLYVWVVCSEYRRQGSHLIQGTGWSSPAVVSVVATGRSYRIVNEAEPIDIYAEPGFSRMFPSHEIRSRILEIDRKSDGAPAGMLENVRQRARGQLLTD
jgi:hypothetical protein